ncbi:MAG: hypothetical protein ABSD63_16340 [Candidatus Korobacteraceae bacterium]|jgi:hypothetical protein
MSTLGLLALIAVVLPLCYVYKRCVSHGRVEINHVATFTFGYLFYWITPLVVRIYFAKVNFPMVSIWSSLFRARLIVPYALSCIALYICFALGDSLGLRLFRNQPRRPSHKVPRLALSFMTVAGCLLLVYTAFAFRGALSRRASPTDLAAQAARGAVTTCVILLGIVCLIWIIDRPEVSWRRRLGSSYFLSFIAGSLFMLWLGSRLYVASFVVVFAIYQTLFRKRLKLKMVVGGAIVLALFFGAVGMWREEGDISGALFNVAEEPMLNSLSLVHYLRYEGISWFNTPTQLARDFMNLIPTVLLPNKYEILKKPKVYQPLGGLSSFVSLNLNFGIIGSALFLFLWPIPFRYLKSRLSNTLYATMYVMCSGWLAFTFFRDAFSISLVKAIFQDSIVIPLVIVALGYLLTAACSPAANADGRFPEPRTETL